MHSAHFYFFNNINNVNYNIDIINIMLADP